MGNIPPPSPASLKAELCFLKEKEAFAIWVVGVLARVRVPRPLKPACTGTPDSKPRASIRFRCPVALCNNEQTVVGSCLALTYVKCPGPDQVFVPLRDTDRQSAPGRNGKRNRGFLRISLSPQIFDQKSLDSAPPSVLHYLWVHGQGVDFRSLKNIGTMCHGWHPRCGVTTQDTIPKTQSKLQSSNTGSSWEDTTHIWVHLYLRYWRRQARADSGHFTALSAGSGSALPLSC